MVYMDAMPVPAADRIGEEGKGFYYLLDGLNPERILVAAEAVALGKLAIGRATPGSGSSSAGRSARTRASSTRSRKAG